MRAAFLSGLVACLVVGAGCARVVPPAARVVAKAASLAVGEAEAAGAALRAEALEANVARHAITSQAAKNVSSNVSSAGRTAGSSSSSGAVKTAERVAKTGERGLDWADLALDFSSGPDPSPTRNVPPPPPPLPMWPGTWGRLEYPVITDVDPFGPAARAGVRPGDILLSYNGVDLSNETSTNDVLDAAIDAAAARRQVTAVILIGRHGQLLQGVVPAGVRMGIRYRTSR